MRTLIRLLSLLLLLTACTGGGGQAALVREVAVDGGSESVVATRGVNLVARPGDTIRIRHANMGVEGRQAAEEAAAGEGTAGTIVHAFTSAPADGLPPLFVEGGGGVLPNAGVWGACRGGQAEAALGTCPVLPIDGPSAWDGRSYWSTGAMLPTESRDIPLAPDITAGTHRLLCALHPGLFVDVVVTDEPGAATEPDAAPAPAAPDVVLAAAVGPAVASEAAQAGGRPGPTAEVVVAPSGADTTLTAFAPATVEVAVGQPVRWTTASRAPHDVVLGAEEPPELDHSLPIDGLPALPGGPWDGEEEIRSGFLSTDPSAPGGTTATVTFAAAGTYTYHCRFHPSMTGTVVVR